MCKLSVIVPLYNGEKTIGRCLDSLINQSFRDMEILVINDGSTDEGEKVVESYMERDKRIRLFYQNNQGQGAARNYGIRIAKGKYVGFVDCDDFVNLQMFHIMITALEKTKTQVAICQEKNVYLENDTVHVINETKFQIEEMSTLTSKYILECLLNYKYMSLNSMCYKVVERRVFIDSSIKFPEQHRYAEDMVVSVGILTNVNMVVVIPKSLYYYVHDKNSFTYSYSLKHAEDIYFDWLEIVNYIKKNTPDIFLDNFSFGMCFSSQKHICWLEDKAEKKGEKAKEILKRWRQCQNCYQWKPRIRGKGVPFLHAVKIYAVYFHLCKPMFAFIKRLQWIPAFKYLT